MTKSLRVTGEVHTVDDAGVAGPQVGFPPSDNFWIGDFPFGEILEGHELRAALRATGADGVDALDNFQVVGRPLSALGAGQ